jgi:two-component system OmpR family response regulator
MTVLVADDYAPFREMVADYLALNGCEVLQAGNGLEVLWQTKHEHPSTILLDLTMPRVDGFETLKRLRAFDPAIRIIVVTGSADAATRDRALAAGAAAVLVKPIDLAQLMATLDA